MISIHAFRRECDDIKMVNMFKAFVISIHAFRRECDRNRQSLRPSAKYFNPRIPQGMRQDKIYSKLDGVPISIHAFRRECDGYGQHWHDRRLYFNPRIPQGMRLASWIKGLNTEQFQSTHSAGNATFLLISLFFVQQFQSTHSAGNATIDVSGNNWVGFDFNPRIPQGMRRYCDV